MPDVLKLLGGLGLFLMGMTVMRDGLKSLADRTATQWMTRFTRTPPLAALTGFVITVLVQSSTAVSVMSVGFVGAGLLTFPHALGVILGANVGSTVTGWLVALVGMKFDLQVVTLPIIFVGSIMRLFGRRKVAAAGSALAGFGLIFTGVAVLQQGLQGMEAWMTPATFPGDTVWGRFLLLLLGLGITLVTHSSAAGVAFAVAAVHNGNLSLSQAAAMVIGMDVGTTATAALATIGATINARRTGFSHVIFNLLTAIGAFAVLPFYIQAMERFAPHWTSANPELALVSFHSAFNLAGVLIALPFTNSLARLVEWLVPQRNGFTSRLEQSLLLQPDLALANVRVTLVEIMARCAAECARLLSSATTAADPTQTLEECRVALEETRQYLDKIPRSSADPENWRQQVACLHAVDHLARLINRLGKVDRLDSFRRSDDLRARGQSLVAALSVDLSKRENMLSLSAELKSAWAKLHESMESHRRTTVEQAASGAISTVDALAVLDSFRWLQRVSFHFYRVAEHLFNLPAQTAVPAELMTGQDEESPDLD